jgi:hypothetical protein
VSRAKPDSAAIGHHRPFERVLMAVEFLHGTLRAIFLVPVVGDLRSRQIGVFTGSILILAAAYLLVPWLHAANTKSLISVGALWVALTVAFEFTFGHWVFGRSWEDLASTTTFFGAGFF